jgi:hypothetical protein
MPHKLPSFVADDARPEHAASDAEAWTTRHRTMRPNGGLMPQGISFEDDWNAAGNADVRAYTQAQVEALLSAYSDDLKEIIDKQGCALKVVKGCHQATDPHFTVTPPQSTRSCKIKDSNIYKGSSTVHIPC